MANKSYWRKRIEETTQNKFDLKYKGMEEETRKLYARVTKQIVREVEDLYFKLLDEELTRTEIWTYKHYKDLMRSININMAKLGMKEIDILNGNLKEALREIYNEVPLPKIGTVETSFAVIDDVRVQQVLSTVWAEKHFSNSIWSNKEQLVKILEKGITDCIIKGQSKDKLVMLVKARMGVGFRQADRIVRSELMHALNEGNRQRYKDNDYDQVEVLVTHDERLCDKCGPMSGKIFSIDDTDNLPIYHANCRCCFVPVIK